MNALERLWSHAAGELRIEHPDPNVYMDLVVNSAWGESVAIRMYMRNLRDTSNRDRFQDRSFSMVLNASVWPGYELARISIVGAWSLYIMHECMELAVTRSTRNAVVDPHHENYPNDSNGKYGRFIQDQLSSALNGSGRIDQIVAAAAFIIGPSNARDILARDKEKAKRELDIESEMDGSDIAPGDAVSRMTYEQYGTQNLPRRMS